MVHRALIAVTSTEKYPDMNRATGLWLGQAAHFYHELVHHGWQVDFVSPRGGLTPIDPMSLQQGTNEIDWTCYADPVFRQKIANTHKPSQVNPDQYQCFYYAGGHGVVYDFLDNKELHEIARRIYEKGGIVSSVCHGAVGLINLKLSNGQYLIKGKKVTSFSNLEEKQVGLDTHVPYLTETELKTRGAEYTKGDNWKEHVVVDGNLITGQNPGSSLGVAKAVLKSHK